jgi:hypothetical protein
MSLMQVGAFILVMAEIFSGLASMPRWLMMKPSSFPEGTPKTHLFGLSFHRYSCRDAKVSLRSAMSVSKFRVLMTTPSTQASTFLLGCLLKQAWIAHWYVAPAFFNPNEIVV